MFAIVNEYGAIEVECGSREGCERVWRAMIQRGRQPRDIVQILGDAPKSFDSGEITAFLDVPESTTDLWGAA